jgi:hypothetical protein
VLENSVKTLAMAGAVAGTMAAGALAKKQKGPVRDGEQSPLAGSSIVNR